jgi:hypothetical protein
MLAQYAPQSTLDTCASIRILNPRGKSRQKTRASLLYSRYCVLCTSTNLPSRNLAISCHLLPMRLCAATTLRSSSSVHSPFFVDGSSLFRYRCLHCITVRPGRLRQICVHFPWPRSCTSRMSFSGHEARKASVVVCRWRVVCASVALHRNKKVPSFTYARWSKKNCAARCWSHRLHPWSTA